MADKNADPEALPMFDVRTMDAKDFEKLLLSVFCWAYVWSRRVLALTVPTQVSSC